jgi:5-carboxymethyl-2-hydroxymuconate isomerase
VVRQRAGRDQRDRAEIAAAISAVLAKTFAAKAAGATWDANTGKLKLTFKRPSSIHPPQ